MKKRSILFLLSCVVICGLLSACAGLCRVDAKDSIAVGEIVSFSQFGLFDYTVQWKKTIHNVDSAEEPHTIFLLTNQEGESYYHTSVLLVQVSDNWLPYYFDELALGETLYTADLNGEGLEELVMQRHLDDFGGAGQYCSYIFNLGRDNIEELFCSIVSCGDDFKVFDTGFSCETLENYQMRVKNNVTGYSITVDISAKYSEDCFAPSGKLLFSPELFCDSFFDFYPEDVNGDGVFEIVGSQYAYLDIHGNGLGCANSVMEFDSQSKTFQVIDVNFKLQ